MLDIAPYNPCVGDLPDHIAETVSLGVGPNSAFKLPEGCSFIVPPEDGGDQIPLCFRNTKLTPSGKLPNLFFGNSQLGFTPLIYAFPDQFCGIVASIKERDSLNTDLGLPLTVVVKLPFSPNSDPSFHRGQIYDRINAYSSRALLAHDFTAIRVGPPP